MDRKIALVTGSNRGIEKEISKQLMVHDFFVFMTGRDKNKVKEAQKEIDADGSKSCVLQLDVTSSKEFITASEKISSMTDHIDMLVNNAGIIGSSKGMIKMIDEEFISVISTNSFGPLHLIRARRRIFRQGSFLGIVRKSIRRGGLHGRPHTHLSKSKPYSIIIFIFLFIIGV